VKHSKYFQSLIILLATLFAVMAVGSTALSLCLHYEANVDAHIEQCGLPGSRTRPSGDCHGCSDSPILIIGIGEQTGTNFQSIILASPFGSQAEVFSAVSPPLPLPEATFSAFRYSNFHNPSNSQLAAVRTCVLLI
jgi:hypothetical protein